MIDTSAQNKLMRQVTIARPLLEQSLLQLLRDQVSVAVGPVGINRGSDRVEYLIRGESRALSRGSPQGYQGVIAWVDQLRTHPVRTTGAAAQSTVILTVERAPQYGRLYGEVWTPAGEVEPIHSVKIVGPGMYREEMLAGASTFNSIVLTSHVPEKYSRVAGAMTTSVWQRFRNLHVVIVGGGRTGSLVKETLVRQGVLRITLIDPDRVEAHNVDSMDGVTDRDVGRQKVSALADSANTILPKEGKITAWAERIETLRAYGAVKDDSVDIIICCVDDDGARAMATIIATAYNKPLLDIGAGVFYEPRTSDTQLPRRTMGGTVRFTLPYNGRCLFCFGGFADRQAALSPFDGSRPRLPIPWHQQRAGSLRSLNQIVAHLGINLLQDFVAERVTESRFLQFEVADDGTPTIQTIHPPPNPNCPLCSRFYGIGDDLLSRIAELKEALTQSTTS